MERKIKTFHDKVKAKQLLTTKPAPQKTFKGILYIEDKDKHSHESMGINKSHQMSR
jgi:hypothetical protein